MPDHLSVPAFQRGSESVGMLNDCIATPPLLLLHRNHHLSPLSCTYETTMADAAPKLEQAPDATPKAKRPPRRKGNTNKATKAATKAANEATHFALVLEAAQATVRIFTKEGIPCASFGSLASKLYGSARCPKVCLL